MTASLRSLERKLALKAAKSPAKAEVKPAKPLVIRTCPDITRTQSFWDNAVLS